MPRYSKRHYKDMAAILNTAVETKSLPLRDSISNPSQDIRRYNKMALTEQEKLDLNRTAISMINTGLQKVYKQLLVLQEDVITFPATPDNIQEITDIETRLANIIQTVTEIL